MVTSDALDSNDSLLPREPDRVNRRVWHPESDEDADYNGQAAGEEVENLVGSNTGALIEGYALLLWLELETD